jgi:hypothetical protein
MVKLVEGVMFDICPFLDGENGSKVYYLMIVILICKNLIKMITIKKNGFSAKTQLKYKKYS